MAKKEDKNFQEARKRLISKWAKEVQRCKNELKTVNKRLKYAKAMLSEARKLNDNTKG